VIEHHNKIWKLRLWLLQASKFGFCNCYILTLCAQSCAPSVVLLACRATCFDDFLELGTKQRFSHFLQHSFTDRSFTGTTRFADSTSLFEQVNASCRITFCGCSPRICLQTLLCTVTAHVTFCTRDVFFTTAALAPSMARRRYRSSTILKLDYVT